jgi:hypothetical protein
MLDTASLKKRIRHAAPPESSGSPVDRVCRRLASLECGHLRARNYGQHIVIEPTEREKPRDRDAIARLTALGEDVYGLSFRRAEGGWEPMVLIDTLDEIVWEMVAAVTPDPPEVEETVTYETFDLGSLD